MDDFCFSDAARLYAENASFVDLMWNAMKKSFADFLDLLREEVSNQVAPREILEWRSSKNGNREWKLKPRDETVGKNLSFQVPGEDPRTVVPGELWFWIGTEQANLTSAIIKSLHSLRQDTELSQYVLSQGTGSWTVIEGKIPYLNGNPIATTAPVVASFLRKITAVLEDP
jgi:hypothetical protein